MRNLILAAAALAMLASHSASAAPAQTMQDEPITLKVMSFNIWYGGDQVDFGKVAEAVRLADPDIVGVQEPDGNLDRLAQAVGFAFVDHRRNIISRYPLFDSGAGQRVSPGGDGYGVVALDPDALHAWVMVRPGRVVAMANTHLSSDPFGPDAVRAGAGAEAVMALETRTRAAEAAPFAALGRLAEGGVPVFMTGDFNTPSHLDWTPAVQAARPNEVPYGLNWPTTALLAQAGLRDSYREAHPDPVADPGHTWTPGSPPPVMANVDPERIDFVMAAGPVRTETSRIVGETDGPGVDIAVTPYPSDHRAVLSTFTVTPSPAPALIAVEPAIVTAGETFMLRFHLPDAERLSAVVTPRDGRPDQALTGVIDEDARYRTAVRVSSLGLAPGPYDAVLADPDGAVAARVRFNVAPAGQTPQIQIATPQVAPGSPIRVRWSGARGNRHDWLGVFHAGEPSVIAYLATRYVDALPEGEVEMDLSGEAALAAGDYEVRLMKDDSYVVLARAPFTVAAP